MFSVWRCLRPAACALTALALGPFLSVPPAPAGALSEIILFSQLRPSLRYAIFAMRPDGNELRTIANLPLSCREPNLCAATDTVLFSALVDKHWHIFSVNMQTSEIKHHVGGRSDARHPAWLPDGRHFVFESDRWGQSELAMFDIATEQTQRLTFNQGINRHPSVSPDGSQVAYTSWLHGTPYIFLLTLNTGRVNDPTAWEDMWEPDTLVGKREQLTRGYHPTIQPCWFGANKAVLFTEQDYKGNYVGINSNDNELKKNLHDSTIGAENPACSPDGTRVIFVTKHKKDNRLKVTDLRTWVTCDFPRQFQAAPCDLAWQRHALPWSLESLTQDDLQSALEPSQTEP